MIDFFTIQHPDFLSAEPESWTARGRVESPHWTAAYEWMKQRYREHASYRDNFELIWLWQSPEEGDRRDFQHKALSDLFCDLEIALDMVFIELAIPSELVLRSSYHRWNVLMDYSIVFGQAPECREDWMPMFVHEPVNENDRIQGVVPRIEKAWVKEIRRPDESLLRKYCCSPTGGDARAK